MVNPTPSNGPLRPDVDPWGLPADPKAAAGAVASAFAAAQEEWEVRQEQRLADLQQPYGWLSLTGFAWLPRTPQHLPAELGLPGRWVASGDVARVEVGADAGLRVLGGEVAPRTPEPAENADEDEPAPDAADGPTDDADDGTVEDDESPFPLLDGVASAQVEEGDSLTWLARDEVHVELIRRGGRYAVRLRDPEAVTRVRFPGIPRFDYDPMWVKAGHFEPYPQPQTLEVGSCREDLVLQQEFAGDLTLELAGGTVRLRASRSADGSLHVAFSDPTNGTETPAWRFVDVPRPDDDGHCRVDFNEARCYPFAFTHFGTCPAPVDGNLVPIPVRAGEKAVRRSAYPGPPPGW